MPTKYVSAVSIKDLADYSACGEGLNWVEQRFRITKKNYKKKIPLWHLMSELFIDSHSIATNSGHYAQEDWLDWVADNYPTVTSEMEIEEAIKRCIYPVLAQVLVDMKKKKQPLPNLGVVRDLFNDPEEVASNPDAVVIAFLGGQELEVDSEDENPAGATKSTEAGLRTRRQVESYFKKLYPEKAPAVKKRSSNAKRRTTGQRRKAA